ncbi:MAG: NVEALA domain-containing protein [Muribaculaceae bacterium]|nr:NVEALA domain-containing protein [Muribaculaceae bacterium]
MKKKLFFSAALIAVIGAVCFTSIRSNSQNRELSDLELENIEALTSGEVGSGVYLFCDKTTISFKCNVKCAICKAVWGTKYSAGTVSLISGVCDCGSTLFYTEE